jgi:hypothetical protein
MCGGIQGVRHRPVVLYIFTMPGNSDRPSPVFTTGEERMDNTTLLIVVIVLILLVGGGGWYGRGRWF